MIFIIFNFNSVTNSKGWIVSVTSIFFTIYFKLIGIRKCRVDRFISFVILFIYHYCFCELRSILKKMVCKRVHCYFIYNIHHRRNR